MNKDNAIKHDLMLCHVPCCEKLYTLSTRITCPVDDIPTAHILEYETKMCISECCFDPGTCKLVHCMHLIFIYRHVVQLADIGKEV